MSAACDGRGSGGWKVTVRDNGGAVGGADSCATVVAASSEAQPGRVGRGVDAPQGGVQGPGIDRGALSL